MTSRGKVEILRGTTIIAIALGVLVMLGTGAAVAQPAAAIGKPLPDPSLSDGTVVVRLIAGERTRLVTATEVTLVIAPLDCSGAPALEQRVKTDAEGRATFVNIPLAAGVQARAQGASGVVLSSVFPMPASGGVRVMVSTVPVSGVSGAGDVNSGPAPKLSLRSMSGQPAPQATASGDELTVRVSYDDFGDLRPPQDHPVVLVDYRWDQVVSAQVAKTDAFGRAVFRGLSRGGSHSYFAMTFLPRGASADRLVSWPIVMPGDVGQCVVLAGDTRAAEVAVDDLGVLDPQPAGGVAASRVNVTMIGAMEPGIPVELIDVRSGEVLAKTIGGAPVPDPESIEASWDPGRDDLAGEVGSLTVELRHAGASANSARVDVRRVDLPVTLERQTRALWAATGGGEISLTGLAVDERLEVRVTIDGVEMPTQIVKLPSSGSRRMKVDASWRDRGQGSATFTEVNALGADRAFVVRAVGRATYVSAPFQLSADRGAAVTLRMIPRVMLSFSLSSWIDDVYLGVRGTFSVRNTSWAPYIAGTNNSPEEVVVALPGGFIGATVRQDSTEVVGVDPTKGFVIRRPLPPGGLEFVGAFSMEYSGGELTWDMPLPLGSLESGIEIRRDSTAMAIALPAGVKGVSVREAEAKGTRAYVLEPITILPGQRMMFTIAGLPRPAAWSRHASVIAGLLVLLCLIGGVGVALTRSPMPSPGDRARYDQLLGELAGLDGQANQEARREELMAELEQLHRHGTAG